ncbi:MAG: hypothetical protein DYG92_09460 [Leptolyngbya sp. PLA1]|nr:hypothetical protein [Leptolyngbya sp. PLA1]
MRVTRCVCRGLSFATLLADARAGGLSLDQLVESTGCGTGCGLCLPYLLKALRTGEAEQGVLSAAEFDRLMAEYRGLTPRDTRASTG